MAECPICASEHTRELLKWKKFTIHRCADCKLTFSTPLPTEDELKEYYQGFLFNKPRDFEIKRKTGQRRAELKKLFGMKEGKSPKTFFDHGGGTGMVYHAAREMGYRAYYYDVDEEAIAFTRKTFGLTDENLVTDLDSSDQSFDYIFSDNVIEHIPDPEFFVRDLLSHLKDGGLLVIKTPHSANTEILFNPLISFRAYFLQSLKYNSPSRACRAFASRFWHCDPPRHLFSFSRQSLKAMMDNIGDKKLSFEIGYYKIPWMRNTLSRYLYSKRSLKSIVLFLPALPFIIIELILQTSSRLLLLAGHVKAGGIYLKIKKS